MGFYEDIRNIYSNNAAKHFRAWASISRKLAKFRNNRNLLLTCRRENIVPRHITDIFRRPKELLHCSSSEITNAMLIDCSTGWYYFFIHRILSLEIKIANKHIPRLEKLIHKCKVNLKQLNKGIFLYFQYKQQLNYNKIYNMVT